jgi:hypothetical protein
LIGGNGGPCKGTTVERKRTTLPLHSDAFGVVRLNAYFETYRSGDEYDREAITHVMACSAHFPGYLLQRLG